MADLLGFTSPLAMRGKAFGDYWDDVVKDLFPTIFSQFKAGLENPHELQLRRCDGQPVTVILTCRVQRDEEGRFVRTHCTLIDISERRAQATQILEVNAELEDMVSSRTDLLNKAIVHLHRLASEDALTGLWRRWRFEETAKQEIKRSQRYGIPLSLVALDVDHFNGHPVGDQVLIQLSQLLKQNLRSVDALARWSGDEFMILLPHTSEEDARTVLEKLRVLIAETDFPSVGKVTFSAGMVEWRPDLSFDKWFAQANDALNAVKAGGQSPILVPAQIE
jgi:diguanylate cyclase (GGDEF)-like protein